MSTPRKNIGNYSSPYAKPVHQYPSQSEDYLTLNAGGPGPAPQPRRQGYGNFRGRYSSTPAKYNNYHNRDGGNGIAGYFYQDTRGEASGGRGGQSHNAGGNYRNNYNSNDTGCGSSGKGGRNKFSFSRGGRGGVHQKLKPLASKEESFALYFHPTMLEDPWKDLMERLNAIRKSEINLQDSTHPQEKDQMSSSSEAESGNDNENINENEQKHQSTN